MSDDNAFSTDKMALVAYLRLQEKHYNSMEKRGDQVIWVFSDGSDPALKEDVELFVNGEAMVDPLEYTRVTARVRTEMFRFKEQQDAAVA